MYKNQVIGVVIPAFQEERLIADTLLGIPDFIDRIIVVDDGSTDRTHDIIRQVASQNPKILTIHHDRNHGVGAAIASGYRQAKSEGLDITLVMAGDNQMDPGVIPDLIDPIISTSADYTKGNRLLYGEYRKGMSKWRFFGNACLTLLTKIASGYWTIMDPQNGYTAISRKALSALDPDSLYPGYGYCNDILVKLNTFGMRVTDVSHPSRYGSEKSKIRYSTYILRVSLLLLRDFFWRLKMKYILLSFHPLVFFYIFGILFTCIGILGGIYSIYYKLFEDYPFFIRGALSLLVFMLGTQFIFFAMLFDMEQERDLLHSR